MTASKAFRENSVTWKGTAIPGVMGVEEQETVGGVTLHRSDNNTTDQATFVDGVGAIVTVTSTDLSLRGSTGYTVGANGALVVIAEQRAEGVGAVSLANKTHTYGDATLIGIENSVPINGEATIKLTFRCVDPAGAAVCVFS